MGQLDRATLCSKINEAISMFQFEGTYISHQRYGNGHINDTFLVETDAQKYILQRINHDTFKDPEALMENIKNVTDFIAQQVKARQGDLKREVLTLIQTKDDHVLYHDSMGSYWRAYLFIDNAITYDLVEKPEDFYQSALAFGKFQRDLAAFPAEKLHETIPHFHHTPKRLLALKEAIQEDPKNRVKDVQAEIDFILNRASFTTLFIDLYEEGKLEKKVTHNDTKLNNVMIDTHTNKALCVIDLDTVMPGFALDDYGDSIRFGASTALEDERDLDKVDFDLGLFELYTKGFIEGCGNSLSALEIELFPSAAKMLTLECGIRFLTDHILGDHYFNIKRENHNLDRTRTQLKLVEKMEEKWDDMEEIIKKHQL
ncbi:MAG TPA: aminoglycoside phosphotransferase family protein [Erysipelothrix sp.]